MRIYFKSFSLQFSVRKIMSAKFLLYFYEISDRSGWNLEAKMWMLKIRDSKKNSVKPMLYLEIFNMEKLLHFQHPKNVFWFAVGWNMSILYYKNFTYTFVPQTKAQNLSHQGAFFVNHKLQNLCCLCSRYP